MKPRFFILHVIFLLSLYPFNNLWGGEIEFTGSTYQVIETIPEISSGLDAVYTIYNTNNVSIIYTPSSNQKIEWLKYSNLGGGYAEEIPNIIYENGQYILNNLEGDLGYIIKDGEKSFNFWIVDYSNRPFRINSISESSEKDCSATVLNFDGEASPIYYYGISGRQFTLSRDITLEYENLIWDSEKEMYVTELQQKNFASLGTFLSVTPPNYCSTQFIMSGDRFQNIWGIVQRAETGYISATAVDVQTVARQVSSNDNDEMNPSNQVNNENDGLGGSAPCTIDFYAYVTDGVLHNEWQIAEDEEFNYIEYRFNEQDLSYTFNEEGTKYVRFVGSNSDGSCEAFGDTYKVSIGASLLLIPNAFSPNGDGVNDEWKVSYRSLIDFKCWIFDRHGHQIFYFDNPDKGWDGTDGGKKVKPGVYYYVIQATGADNQKYKKSGDINILNYLGAGSGQTPEE